MKIALVDDEGKIILLDRYTTSSLIYQSALIENLDDKKDFIKYVVDFEYNKLGVKEVVKKVEDLVSESEETI